MAQTQKPTTLGYAEMTQIFATVTTAMAAGGSGLQSVVGLTGACTAAEASTFANPGGATKLAANGFALVDADSVTPAGAVTTLAHQFTCTGDQSVSGFAVENDDDDVVFGECCFASALAMESAGPDTLDVEMTFEFKLGA